MFAYSKNGYLRPWNYLNEACKDTNMKSPETINSTYLRKYVTTVVQTLMLTEQEMDWLAPWS